MRRRVIVAVLILAVATIAGCIGTIAEGYVRAPDIVAEHIIAHPPVLDVRYIPSAQIREMLAVEDPKFYTHWGVDFTTPGAGMTTITQGLVKFLYFDEFRPGLSKIRQTLLAIGFDARVDKQIQLAIFMNSANMGTVQGRDIRGFENAARFYFRKPFQKLTRREFLALVAMCVGPNEFNVRMQPYRNAIRVGRIERLLRGECQARNLRDVYYNSCIAK